MSMGRFIVAAYDSDSYDGEGLLHNRGGEPEVEDRSERPRFCRPTWPSL